MAEEMLEMIRLTPAMKESCRKVFAGFLKSHSNLDSYPLRVTLEPVGLMASTPQQCYLEVQCGYPGARWGHLTATPEWDLNQSLGRWLEISLKQHLLPA